MTIRGSRGKVGRPRVEVPASRIVQMRDSGQSFRTIANALRMAVTTVHRAYHTAKDGPTPYQNSGEANE
jgi:DNA invertase Pin-like site-specific DNA recombinase